MRAAAKGESRATRRSDMDRRSNTSKATKKIKTINLPPQDEEKSKGTDSKILTFRRERTKPFLLTEV